MDTSTLTARQQRAVVALLTCPDLLAAAKAAGVNRNTLFKWRQEPAFQAALKSAEAVALAEVSRSLVVLAAKATGALSDAMAADAPVSARLRAADIVLSRLLQLRELVELEERVRMLEERMQV